MIPRNSPQLSANLHFSLLLWPHFIAYAHLGNLSQKEQGQKQTYAEKEDRSPQGVEESLLSSQDLASPPLQEGRLDQLVVWRIHPAFLLSRCTAFYMLSYNSINQ